MEISNFVWFEQSDDVLCGSFIGFLLDDNIKTRALGPQTSAKQCFWEKAV